MSDMSFPIPDFEQADVRKLAVQMLDYSKYLQRNTTKEDARRDLAERLARDGILLFSYEVPEKIVAEAQKSTTVENDQLVAQLKRMEISNENNAVESALTMLGFTNDAPPRLLPCSPKTRTLSDYSTGC